MCTSHTNFSGSYSGTVAAALRLSGGSAVQKTAEYIDRLNVTNYDEGKHTRNPFKDLFHPGDFMIRLKVCDLLLHPITVDPQLSGPLWPK